MIKTKMTELLGIQYPILMGAMAWITTANLTAAVSNAGGAGVLGAGGRDENWVRQEIRKTKSLTNKPFGINLSLQTTPLRDKLVEVILEEGIDFVTLGAGDPRPFLPRFKEAGIKTVCIVPNTKLAKRMEACGADMLIIEGMESGGRIGNLTTMALMSNVLPEVSLPIAAAGGIVDGRGLAAALIMGADGIQMGSRFLLAKECESHPSNAKAILAASDTDSVTIGWSRGKGLRGLKNPFAEKYLSMETSGVPTDQLGDFVAGCSKRVADLGTGEDGMNGIVQVGESLEPLKKIQSAAEIIQEVTEEAKKLLKKAPQFVSQ
ncbi:nitronate monooxygenase [Hominifimenecus sp. rT4P-3]|uniref:nitronate monooxygenase n=1 Tax=Hominifimenecus sp. rT4P-3 TaxID=3242979 RepID=UPI003DA420F0